MQHAALALVPAAAACAAPSRAPAYPPFEGFETAAWLAYEVAFPKPVPEDILASFEASARGHGCRTDPIGGGSHRIPRSEYQIVVDDARYRRGVLAACDEGVVALVTGEGATVKVGCPKPTTRERCDGILEAISASQ